MQFIHSSQSCRTLHKFYIFISTFRDYCFNAEHYYGKVGFVDKTNVYNPFQGNLRYANINYEALYERIKTDSLPYKVKTTIALTHTDEIRQPNDFSYDYVSIGPTRDHVIPFA